MPPSAADAPRAPVPRATPARWCSAARARDGARGRDPPFAAASAGGAHTLVVGATGSGKTVTQTLIAVRAIEQGRGAIVIDPKGDAAMREALRRRRPRGRAGSSSSGRRPGRRAYNPYARASETEIADRLLAGERFTEPHYLRQAQRYLGHAVRALRACGDRGLAAGDRGDARPGCARAAAAPRARGAGARRSRLSRLADAAPARAISPGSRDRLAILAESDAGRWLQHSGAGAELRAARCARAPVRSSTSASSRQPAAARADARRGDRPGPAERGGRRCRVDRCRRSS